MSEFTLEIEQVTDLYVQCSLSVPKFTENTWRPFYIDHFRCGKPASWAVDDDGNYMFRCTEHKSITKMYANGHTVYGDYTTTVPKRVEVD